MSAIATEAYDTKRPGTAHSDLGLPPCRTGRIDVARATGGRAGIAGRSPGRRAGELGRRFGAVRTPAVRCEALEIETLDLILTLRARPRRRVAHMVSPSAGEAYSEAS